MKRLKEKKKKYNLTNNDIASFFSYKSRQSYQNSSAREKIDKGIIQLIERVEDYYLKKEKETSGLFIFSKQEGRKEFIVKLKEWLEAWE